MYVEGDVPYVGTTNGNANSGFFGGDGWWAIILFAMIFGWGNNGWGNNGSGAMNNYVLGSDFATIQRQLSDGFGNLTSQSRFIQNGLCDGFYSMNTSLLNGFSGVNQNIMQNGYETKNAIQGVSSQLADCCCKTQTAIQGVNYNLATQGCAIQNTIQTATRDLIDVTNANYRALHDEIVANRIEDKNAQITAQQNEINALRLAASQANQNTYLIDQLRPTAKPAYITCSPFQSVYGYGCGCGCNTGCGSIQ